jgi:hypothetical protein
MAFSIGPPSFIPGGGLIPDMNASTRSSASCDEVSDAGDPGNSIGADASMTVPVLAEAAVGADGSGKSMAGAGVK